MIYIRNKLVFFHIPKTGGSWFILNMVENCKDKKVFYGSDFHWTRNMHKNDVHWKDVDILKSMVFIRNPLTWYLSFWKYKRKVGWNANSRVSWFGYLTDTCNHPTFEGFMKQVLSKHPGFLTKFYRSYIGENFDQIDYVIKQENLLEGCMEALKECEVNFSKKGFRSFPENNVSDESSVTVSDNLKKRIIETEYPIFEKYYKEEL